MPRNSRPPRDLSLEERPNGTRQAILGPGGRVLLAVYSSGAIGRLAWQDVLGYVQYLQTHS
jgi:hypothetical protein